jgi:hypothetical protein
MPVTEALVDIFAAIVIGSLILHQIYAVRQLRETRSILDHARVSAYNLFQIYEAELKDLHTAVRDHGIEVRSAHRDALAREQLDTHHPELFDE